MDPSFWKIQVHRYRQRLLTQDELDAFWAAWADPANEEAGKEILREVFEEQPSDLTHDPKAWEQMIRGILLPARVVRIHWRRWAVAAAVLALLCVGAWQVFIHRAPSAPAIAAAPTGDVAAPAVNKATLTLSNGQQIVLDSAGNGQLAMEGPVGIRKLQDGQLDYRATDRGMGTGGSAAVLNTITNPRGSRVVNLTLVDGTKIWLNAASSIRYPADFPDSQRTVEVTGEAYFEVASDSRRPFRVKRNTTVVEVLGTAFNVNAYDDEADLRVTLVSGKVQVEEGNRIVLMPQQQAIVTDKVTLNLRPNMQGVMAWKNGSFQFWRTDVQTVMRQLARWYDVDVIYEKGIPDLKFGGALKRELSLSQALYFLSRSGLHYRIEDRKLFIKPS